MSDGPSAGPAGADEQATSDYAGAIYGSLLAGSVVAGTGPGQEPPRPGQLIALLLSTGVVFWLAHVYAHLVGKRSTGGVRVSPSELRAAGRREWPIVQASVPPAAAAALGVLLGLSDAGVAWLALGVAVGSQIGWALYVAGRAGATGMRLVAAGAVNLILGSVIVLLKAALTH